MTTSAQSVSIAPLDTDHWPDIERIYAAASAVSDRCVYAGYTHLMPQAEDRARRAVDNAFKRLEVVAKRPVCGPNVAQTTR